MFAKIKHLAIISDNYALLSRFYEALFGMHAQLFAGLYADHGAAGGRRHPLPGLRSGH